METKNLPEVNDTTADVAGTTSVSSIDDLLSNNLIKTEFFNTIEKFVNEMDIAFDYISKDLILQMRQYIEKLKVDENELKACINNVLDIFKNNDAKLAQLALSNNKIKTKEFDILNEKKLLGDLLDLSIFKEENKNTKKIICKYLYNMYMSSVILSFTFDETKSIESLGQELSTYFEQIQTQYNKANGTNGVDNGTGVSNGTSSKNKKFRHKNQSNTGNLEGMEGMDEIMNSLFANKDLMNIASEFTQDIQKQNINPMMMLGSLMSGKPNKQVTNLINQISGKLEKKISTGELDKSIFEEQANNIMSTLKNTNLTSQLPVLNTILETSERELKNRK
jgi:hypothetical protein